MPKRPRPLSIAVTIATLVSTGFSPAQRPVLEHRVERTGNVTVVTPHAFGRSRPLRDLPDARGVAVPAPKEVRARGTFRSIARAIEPDGSAGAAAAPGPRLPTPSENFDGIANADNATLGYSGVVPPDTNGDAGSNGQYVQMVNLAMAVFDKTNGAVLEGPKLLSDIWTGVGGLSNCDDEDQGDPIVVFDTLADRWILTQFAFAISGGLPTGPFEQCIAISDTADATGAYTLYAFEWDEGDPNILNDYPKFGVWHDAYYMTANQFDCDPGLPIPCASYAGAGAAAFERDAMLTGDPNAQMVRIDLGGDPSLGGMLPADLDGPIPPGEDLPGLLAQIDFSESGHHHDQLRLFEFDVDWATPSDSFVDLRATVDLKARGLGFDPVLCNFSANCIPQADTNRRLDALSDRLMWRLAYRNFATYETLLVAHTIDIGRDRAAVRWYEIRNPSEILLRQGGTIRGDADDRTHRWMPSVAMNAAGDIAAGYSRSGGGINPQIRYRGRFPGSPLGRMPLGEGTIRNGGGSQTGGAGRWGDYTSMSVDPADDCTFWYTNEYYASNSATNWRTRIAAFSLRSASQTPCAALDTGTLSGTVTDGAAPVAGAIVRAGTTAAITDAAGNYAITPIPAGTYTVVASKPGLAPARAGSVVVADGGTTDRDFVLDPLNEEYADFDGDGFGDLAVGAPGENSSRGAVSVIYGSAAGLVATGNEAIVEADTGGSGETGDNFGHALAVGDFDDDGFDDLAIGVPGQTVGGAADAGKVHVLYGSGAGIVPASGQVWHQNSTGIANGAEDGDLFGYALAAGDIDGDGTDDLAVGVPGENGSRGGVNVIFGATGTGLAAAENQFWSQGSPGIVNDPDVGDRFGRSLVFGDFDGDARDDLAVGVPDEDLRATNCGAVAVLYGRASGLTADGDELWSQNPPRIADACESGDRFGWALATGNFDGDARDDLAVGVPREDVGGVPDAGAINVIYGTASGLSSAGDQLWHRDGAGVGGAARAGDLVGWSLAARDFDGDGRDDLAAGAPPDKVGVVGEAGSATVLYGGSNGLTAARDDLWSQNEAGGDFADPGDLFGWSVAAGDFNADGLADLAAGARGQGVFDGGFQAAAGTVNVIPGTGQGLKVFGASIWYQGLIAGSAETGDWFGWVVAA